MSYSLSNSFHLVNKHLLSSYCMPGTGVPAANRTCCNESRWMGGRDALRFPALPNPNIQLFCSFPMCPCTGHSPSLGFSFTFWKMWLMLVFTTHRGSENSMGTHMVRVVNPEWRINKVTCDFYYSVNLVQGFSFSALLTSARIVLCEGAIRPLYCRMLS